MYNITAKQCLKICKRSENAHISYSHIMKMKNHWHEKFLLHSYSYDNYIFIYTTQYRIHSTKEIVSNRNSTILGCVMSVRKFRCDLVLYVDKIVDGNGVPNLDLWFNYVNTFISSYLWAINKTAIQKKPNYQKQYVGYVYITI